MCRSATSFTLLKRFLIILLCCYWTLIIDNLSEAHFLDEDFENSKLINLWMNDSSTDTNKDYEIKWTIVEDDDLAHLDSNNDPDGINGDINHYLIVSGNPDGDFGGVAVLSSAEFTSYPGDTINFNYWIRSRWNQFNNIQLFWSNMDDETNNSEQLLIELFPNSVPGNSLWENVTVKIPIEIQTEIKLVFYGMCGNDALDAIAIDNISIMNENDKPKTTSSSTTMTTPTTQSPSPSTSQRPVTNNCPNGENFLPYCNCLTFNSTYLRCMQISNVIDIHDAFHRPNNRTGSDAQVDFTNLLLDFSSDEKNVFIPEDFLGRIRFKTINIRCPPNDNTFHVEVHPDAFLSSGNYTNTLNILSGCDVTGFNFTFLRALEPALNSFAVDNSFNIHLAEWRKSFPSLDNLSTLRLFNNTGADEWTEYPKDSENLKLTNVFYHSNGVKDEGMARFLDWLLEHSKDHLQKLEIQWNLLTKIPKQIGSFKKLNSLAMQLQTNRSIPIIPKNSLEFSVQVFDLNISSCGVTTIEPGAFLGNVFSKATINLSNNSLTRFDESVFRPVLEQMTSSTGSLNIYQNPFNCADDPCHLSWLLKDNRKLLPAVIKGTCASGIPFKDLDPAIFIFCDSY